MRTPPSLTDGPIGIRLLRFALPILFAGVLQSLSVSVNSVWIGHSLGEVALAAASNANTVMFLLVGASFGIALASTLLVAHHVGAQNVTAAKRVVGTSAVVFIVVSLMLTATSLALCKPTLRALGTPEESLGPAVRYMRVILLALPCLYVYGFAMSVLRATGDSTTPFYFSFLTVFVDTVLNPLFIFGAGPVPRLGIAGSALATVIAQAVGLSALIRFMYSRGSPLVLRKKDLWMLLPDWATVGAIFRKGIPMSADLFLLSLSGVMTISLVNSFGVDTTAAFGASLQLWNYIQMPAYAVATAVSTMAAQNVGACKWGRVTSIARLGVVQVVLMTGAVVVLITITGPRSFGLFLPPHSLAIGIGERINYVAAPSFIAFGVALTLFGVVRATGSVLVPLLILAVTLFAVRVPFAVLLKPCLRADAIWWSFPISSIVAAALAWAYYRYGGWCSALLVHSTEDGSTGMRRSGLNKSSQLS